MPVFHHSQGDWRTDMIRTLSAAVEGVCEILLGD
jgi:hypothetical protein